jgi:flagellar biosynthesis protein FlhB
VPANCSASAFFAIVSAMLLIVAVDVPFQLWQYHDKLKMTREEVKQEGKELEGNPRSRAASASCSGRRPASG